MKWKHLVCGMALASSVSATSANAQLQQQPALITLAESKLFEAPNNQVQKFSQSIDLTKGQDKLNLTLTYYNGTNTKPGFSWLRVSSSTMSYFTEKQFGGRKSVSIDVTDKLTSGGNQIAVEGGGVAGSTFGWRLTTPSPSIESVKPQAISPGTNLTVNGNNFCPDKSFNVATVNGAEATCVSATSKNLVLKLPENLAPGQGSLELKVAGLDAGQAVVNVQASMPVVQSLGAGWVLPGAELVINGGPFPANLGNIRATIGPFEAPVLKASPASITVQAPSQFNGNPWGVNQPVKVWVNGIEAPGGLTVNCYQGIAPTGYY